jgi:hypothetical protein
MKKILVSLPEGIVDLINAELIGKIGEKQSDTLRAIILNWLGEHGYLSKGVVDEKSKC